MKNYEFKEEKLELISKYEIFADELEKVEKEIESMENVPESEWMKFSDRKLDALHERTIKLNAEKESCEAIMSYSVKKLNLLNSLTNLYREIESYPTTLVVNMMTKFEESVACLETLEYIKKR